MASVPATFKTYSKKQIHHRRNSSVDVFDALLAENISKRKQAAHTRPRRRKKTIIIRELPPPDENHHLIEDSICRNWRLEDTFDRICKEPVHNKIKHDTNPNNNTNEKKQRTLDISVNESLFIEKVPVFVKPKEMSVLSSSSSLLKSNGSIPFQMRSVPKHNDADVSYERLFSETFRDTVAAKLHIASTPAVASSTPCISAPIVNETMSPILNNTPKSLIESYEEIQKWDFKPPDFVLDELCHSGTPKIKRKKPLQPKKLQKKKEMVINKSVEEKVILPKKKYRERPDWKLKGEAKVVIDKCLDVIGIEKSVTLGHLNESTLGFSPVQEDILKNNALKRSIFEESFRKICEKQNINADDFNCVTNTPSPVRYITLRKRKIPVQSKTKPKNKKTDLGLKTRKQIKGSTSNKKVYGNSSTTNCVLKHHPNVISKLCNFSETSTPDKSILRESIESIQNAVDESNKSTTSNNSSTNQEVITELSKSSNPDCLNENPQSVKQNTTILQSTFNDSDNKSMENVTNKKSNEISATDEINSPCSISLQSFIEPKVIRGKELKHLEQCDESMSDKMLSPDIIPNTPTALKSTSKAKRKLKTLPGSLIEISSLNYSETQKSCSDESIKCNTVNDFTKDTNQDFQMEDGDGNCRGKRRSTSSDEDDNYSTTSQDVMFTNCDYELWEGLVQKDNVTENIFSESSDKLQQSLQKYLNQDNSDLDYSVLEDHNYSKICIYDTDIIEVISSEEEDDEDEDEDENIPIATPSPLVDDYPEHKCNINHISECGTSKDTSTKSQKIDSPSKSNVLIALDSSGKSNTLEPSNFDKSSKVKEHPPNNSDSELDSNEFISPNKKSTSKVQCQQVIDDTIELGAQGTNETTTSTGIQFKTPGTIVLNSGKLWRRSLLSIRRSSIIGDSLRCTAGSGCICSCAKCRQKQSSIFNRTSRRQSIKIIPEIPVRSISHKSSVLENYASFNITYGSNTIQDVVYREKNIGEPLLVRNNSIHEPLPIIKPTVTARDIVLRRCGQAEPISFTECYPSTLLKNCFKIGEGVYGEVFLFKHPDGASRVMKIIPIEGSQTVNGEHQKKFEEILSEIVIAMELSDLRNDKKNTTEGFSKVEKIRCVQGCYPDRLLELWELFDETRGSENDSPEMFTEDQLYIVLELANGGQDLEAFVFNNSLQALALFKQVACALAVGESALQFEHRDLHWGNILISPTDKNKMLTYCLNDQEFEVPACGIQASIIDFTLSRITYDGVCIFNDLSADPELFVATGDYQFEIYKLMQKQNNNEWQHFEPYSNVLWLHYVLHKMASGLRYKNRNSIVHKEGIAKITQLQNRILKYSSVKSMVINEFLS